MQNKNVRQVSEFNNELKLKGFNVFQIEADGSCNTVFTAGKIFIKFVLPQEKAKSIMLIEVLSRKALFCFLAIRTFLIPGRQFQLLM